MLCRRRIFRIGVFAGARQIAGRLGLAIANWRESSFTPGRSAVARRQCIIGLAISALWCWKACAGAVASAMLARYRMDDLRRSVRGRIPDACLLEIEGVVTDSHQVDCMVVSVNASDDEASALLIVSPVRRLPLQA
jgi:hypothetical protein